MEYHKLGSSPLNVSKVCLGSMTWGRQNTQQDADLQLEYALSQGINFIDTAEMYAVPPNEDTYGKTEAIIGDWFSRNPGKREQIVLASKIAGPGLHYIRGGGDLGGAGVKAAVDASLKRLSTDYIDLYQLHWPNRNSPHFGNHWPNDRLLSDVDVAWEKAQMLDTLQGLDDCVKAGKIRYCGLSNETSWGLNQYLHLAEVHNLPRMVSMQNEFHLLHHKDWPHLMENCVHEDIAYLPWSPLSAGLLTGKYLNGARPSGSRWTITQRHGLFRDTQRSNAAVAALLDLAKKHNTSAATLALGWVSQVIGVTSTIIGATNMDQLKENIAAFEQPLNEEVVADLNQLIRQYPMTF